MSLTPNFGLNIPDAGDIVNLLTQCYPNFTLIDTAMQSIKETGVTTATETKSGTTHQIVRTDADCDVLRFTATSNFVTGDTFTVDGNPVTGVAVNGTSLQTGDFVINSDVMAILNGGKLTLLTGGSGANDASDVTYDNTNSGLSATDVQQAIDELDTVIDAINTIVTSLNANKVVYNSVTDMLDVYYNGVVVGSIRAGFQFDGRVFVSGVYYYPSNDIVHSANVTLGASTITVNTSSADPYAYVEIPNVSGYTNVELTVHYNSGSTGNLGAYLYADETSYDMTTVANVSAGNDYTITKSIAGHTTAINIGAGFSFGANASFNITSFRFY